MLKQLFLEYGFILAALFFATFFALFMVRKALIKTETQLTQIEVPVKEERDKSPKISIQEIIDGRLVDIEDQPYQSPDVAKDFLEKKVNDDKKMKPFEVLVKNLVDSGKVKANLKTTIGEQKAFGLKWTGSLEINSEAESEQITDDDLQKMSDEYKKDMKKVADSLQPKNNGKTQPVTVPDLVETPKGGWASENADTKD